MCPSDSASVHSFRHALTVGNEHLLSPLCISTQTECFCFLRSDFERFLIATTHFLHQARKRKEPLEEYLGEVMDFVYRKAGVLQEAGQKDDDGAPA